jgi:hypothetical protein
MTRSKKLLLTSAGIVLLSATLMATGAGPVIADQAKPLLVKVVNTNADPVPTRDIREPFTVHVRFLTDSPVAGCADVPLGAGDVVLEHVDLEVPTPTDGHLRIPAAIASPVGEGVGRTVTVVRLEGVQQNLAEHRGFAARYAGTLRIRDGQSETAGELFRSSDDPVQLCAEDAIDDANFSVDGMISGYIIR